MRKGSIVALLGIGLVAGGVATAVAVIPTWLPVEASEQAGRTAFLFWVVIGICIAIFAVVAAVMVYSIAKFKAAPDDLEDGPSVHGHTGLEITWTAIPLVIVTVIAILSTIVLTRNDALGASPYHIDVTASQFSFTFTYPEAGNATSPVLLVPIHRSIVLDMRALDVIHSVFVPQFAVKEDIVPGLVTHLNFTPTRLTGDSPFTVECTELCGLGHSLMRTQVQVMTQEAFDTWAAHQKAAVSKP